MQLIEWSGERIGAALVQAGATGDASPDSADP
jgi:hypothetical protein